MFATDNQMATRFLKSLWENSHDSFFVLKVVEDDFVLVSINHAEETLLGRSDKEVSGKRLRDLLPPEVYRSVSQNYRRCIAEKQPIQYEEQEHFSRDSVTWWSTMLCPIDCASGEVKYIYGISRNITELKITQQRAETKAFQAKEANRVKAAFMANMSHDMRTPLNGILGAANLICEAKTQVERAELVSIITESAESLSHLTNDILEYAKIDAGKLKLEVGSFDFHKLIKSINQLFLLEAKNKDIFFCLDIDEAFPQYLIGDKNKLKQVLVNLVGNAVKFTDKGGVSIDIFIKDKNHQEVLFEVLVRDTGIGIDNNDIDKLFKPFSQIETAKTRRYEGTGLGLVICQNIIDKMGGHIEVKSELGEGTEFSVLLALPIGDSPSGFTVDALEFNANILVVEDNAVNQVIVEKLLKKNGNRVTIVSNGEEAIEICRVHKYDAILMDWHMPVTDGFVATEHIRKLPSYHDTPILGLTASAFGDDRERAEKAGMDDVIHKPIRPEELTNKLYKWLIARSA